MISSINIKKYKCFQDFEIKGLGQINLISGKNNVGKTALLEVFFLIDEDLFGFFSENAEKKAVIASNRNIDEKQYINYLRKFNYFIGYYYASHKRENSFEVKRKPSLNTKELKEIAKLNGDYDEFICEYANKKMSISPLKKTKMGYVDLIPSSYINSSKPSNKTLVELYSKIQTKSIQHKFLEYLQKLDDNIKWLEPQLINDELVLRVNLKNPEMSLTSSELGEGVNRYIQILATILSSGDSVFIDEIENGLHYSKLVDIAKAIIEISIAENKQLFITTHDKDTIEAFSSACEMLEFEGFRSIELYKDEQQNLKSVVRTTKQFIATVGTGIEVR
ncbi:conserved hypothetical protein [uncultured Candidatus Thioglobus sp.]|nr:conserved hypothetical protein [uncultured Candidatus Thioglobus sp.]